MSSEFYHKRLFERKKSRGERVRPKTFKSEDSANNFAKENNIGKYNIELKGKKYLVIQE